MRGEPWDVLGVREVEPVSTGWTGPDRNLHQSIFGIEAIIPVASGPKGL